MTKTNYYDIQQDYVCSCSLRIDREKLNKLNLDLIDPSDSMNNFECNMNFKKTVGLSKVDRIIGCCIEN
ncbi:MAG: hypothetical protein ACRDA3_11800 [Peptostreptococcaceae bacterium]